MLASRACYRSIRALAKRTSCVKQNCCSFFSTDTTGEAAEGSGPVKSYAQAFEKFQDLAEKKPEQKPQTFASLLRNSKFIDVSYMILKLALEPTI